MRRDEGFRALASPARRRVLTLVRDAPKSVTELAGELGVSQPAVSQHLAALRDARLVTVEVDGRRRIYRPNLEALGELRSFFDEYWNDALDRLDAAALQQVVDRREAS